MRLDLDKLLLHESPDATLVTSVEGRILYWSSGAESIFGYSAADAAGCQVDDLLVPPERVGEHRRSVQQAIETGRSTYESLRRHQNGSLIYVAISIKAIHDEQGDLVCILSSKKDISDLKLSRDAKLIESRFRGLLESMPDGVIMINPTGRIVLASSQAERLFGYERGELHGKPIEQLLPARLRELHVGHRARYFTQPRARAMGASMELYGLRRDGSEFPVEISLSPLQIDEDTLAVSAIRDISDRKRAERVLQEKNVELQNAAEVKNRFLATMSHELRTPLNAVIGFTGTLLMRLPGPLTTEQERQLLTMQGSARHLLSLINDLLDVAKIESGNVEVRYETLAAGDVLEEVATALRPLAQEKKLQLRVHLPGEGVILRTDRRAFSQIVINLANNAIKYTDTGSVDITLTHRSGSATYRYAVSVTDTGCGISADDQKQLFEAFMQVDSSTRRRHEGTGLGLHLSQKLAELLGGRIECQSELGRGSTFTLLLPGI